MEIAILTSSRADYGFYKPLLQHQNKGNIKFKLIVFGTHLSEKHGYTVQNIEEDGIEIALRVPHSFNGDSPLDISTTIGEIHAQFAKVWAEHAFDAILCLGDRYEMYAAVSASVPFNIPVIHLSGGEETLGAIDNYFRHALTLIANVHFTNTQLNAVRVAEIKGNDKNVYHTGSLAIDNILKTELYSVEEFKDKFNFDLSEQFILFTFHPETVNYELNEKYAEEIIAFLAASEMNVLATMPNADTFGSVIREKLIKLQQNQPRLFLYESLGSKGYYSALKYCQCVVGNSSSGIVEAASFKKYTLNIGDRQKGRERGNNVIECPVEASEIQKKIEFIGALPELDGKNIYGDGNAANSMIEILNNTAIK